MSLRPGIIAILLTVLGHTSCNRHTEADVLSFESIKVTNDSEVYLEDCIESIKLIPLDNSGVKMIGSVDKLIVTDDHIVVADYNHKSVCVFDHKGKLISIIDRTGRGPQEYYHMNHVTLTSDRKKIAIYDNASMNMLFYDFNGKFVSRKHSEFWFLAMEFYDDNNLACVTYGLGERDPGLKSGNNKSNLVLFTDGDIKVKSGYFTNRFNPDKFHYITPKLAKFGNKIYLNQPYSTKIYTWDSKEVKGIYNLDLSAVGGILELEPEITDNKLAELQRRKTTFSGDYIDTKDFLLFSLETPPTRTVVGYVYSKSSKKVYRLKYNSDGGDYMINMHLALAKTTYKNQFVSVIPAYYIMKTMDENARQTVPALKGLRESDNPVIAFYTLAESKIQ